MFFFSKDGLPQQKARLATFVPLTRRREVATADVTLMSDVLATSLMFPFRVFFEKECQK